MKNGSHEMIEKAITTPRNESIIPSRALVIKEANGEKKRE